MKKLLILAAVMVLTIGVQAEIIETGNVNIGSNTLTWDAASGAALSITSAAKTFSSGDYAIDVKYMLTGNNAGVPAEAFVGYNAAFAFVTSGNGVVIDGADHLTLTAEVVELRYLGNPISLSNVQSADFIIHTMNVSKTNSNYEVNEVSYINDGTTSGLSSVALTTGIATGYDIRFTNKFGQLWGSQASFEVELIPDTTPPLIDTLAPASGATNVVLGSRLIATFDDSIAAGSGNITISNLTDSTATVIPAGDPRISLAGSMLTIDNSGDLSANKNYAVLFDSDAVLNFAGISDTTTWSFTTKANAQAFWDGSESTEWSDGLNWDAGGVPVEENAKINVTGVSAPVIDSVISTATDPSSVFVGIGGTGELNVTAGGDLRTTMQLGFAGGSGTLILTGDANVQANVFRLNGESSVIDMSGTSTFRSINIATLGAGSYFTLAEGAILKLPGNLTNLVNHADNSGQVRATEFASGDRIQAIYTTETIFTVAGPLPVVIDMDETRNFLADPGFETQSGTELDAETAPWFTVNEESISNFKVSTNRAYTGKQSVVFANYGDKGAIVQTLELQVDATKHYQLSVWMQTDEASTNSVHTNESAINATMYTSPTADGSYTYRKGFFWGLTNSVVGVWEKMEGTLSGAELSAYDGEYIQLRIAKAEENSSHQIYIDNAVLLESDSVDAPKTVSRYLVGGNIVYSEDEGLDWEEKNKVDVLKRAGMSNLRYPGGHVVSFWDWEFPYHSTYANFWDPSYIASLTESKKAELIAENGDRLSLDEHLDLCRETGAAPVIGINMLQGHKYDRKQDSIDKAVRLVNYCKDKITGLRYYYLDNEVGHNIDDYLLLIPDYSAAIKAADPQGKIVANMMTWDRVKEIVRDYGDYVDLYDHHWYYNNIAWGQFWPNEWRADVNMGLYTSRLNQFKGWVETYNKPHLKIGFLEWNLGPSTGADGSTPGTVFYQGLVQADMLMHMICHDVHMASTWPLTFGDNFRNLIDETDHTVSPTFYIHRALSKAAGGTVLNLSVPDTGGLLRSLAVKSADEGFIDCYFLNKSTEAIDLDLELPVPIVETMLMNFAQGAASNEVNISEQHYAGDFGVLALSLGDTSFTHVRCRISDSPTSYELFADDFESTADAGNVASAPYPVGSWHHQGIAEWKTEGSAASVDMGEFNGVTGNELRLGWGYDEVVALYSTPTPIHTSQTYTFRGRWEVGSVLDAPRGFIAGIAEFSADDGSLVQRLTPDTLVFGITNAPVVGDAGTFEVTLGSTELAAAGTAPGNRIGLFLHHDDGGDLYDDSHALNNDVYYIDNLTLEVSGAITLLDQWMVAYKVADELSDSDGDGVDNRMEYWFGGDPTLDDASVILPTVGMVPDLGTNWMEYVYRRRSDYQARGLVYTVEATTNLVSNDWSTNGVFAAGSGFIDVEVDSVTNRVSTESEPEQFIRLNVEGY